MLRADDVFRSRFGALFRTFSYLDPFHRQRAFMSVGGGCRDLPPDTERELRHRKRVTLSKDELGIWKQVSTLSRIQAHDADTGDCL